jgi:uncharacterized protein YecT (DUF1311 family)
MSRFALVLIFFSVLSLAQQDTTKQSSALDAGLPCDTAGATQMELNRCYNEQYKKVDAHLNVVYRKVMELLELELKYSQRHPEEEQIKHAQTAIQKLKATEKAWISYRDMNCEAAEFEYGGGSISPMMWSICMTTVTEHRIADLKSAYESPDRKIE